MGARASAPIVDIDDVTTLDALPSATTAEGGLRLYIDVSARDAHRKRGLLVWAHVEQLRRSRRVTGCVRRRFTHSRAPV